MYSDRVNKEVAQNYSNNKKLLEGKKVKTKGGPQNCDEWQVQHCEAFRVSGLPWPPSWDSDEDLKIAVQHLAPRMQEGAFYHCHRPRPSEKEDMSKAKQTTTNISIHPGSQIRDSGIHARLLNLCTRKFGPAY